MDFYNIGFVGGQEDFRGESDDKHLMRG